MNFSDKIIIFSCRRSRFIGDFLGQIYVKRFNYPDPFKLLMTLQQTRQIVK